MYVHVYIHIYMYTLQVKTNYSVGILRQGGKSGLCLYRETLQNRDKGKDLGWGGGGGSDDPGQGDSVHFPRL